MGEKIKRRIKNNRKMGKKERKNMRRMFHAMCECL